MVFNAGEWQAKLGDGQQLRGYYSALLVREGDEVKILEETVNVACPKRMSPFGTKTEPTRSARPCP
jgi:hypothetical protein